MKHIYRYTPAIVVVVYLFLFMGLKSPERPWDRIINSDGKGYYAYLPAIFIYHDLQFRFVEQYEYQYYPSNQSVFKEFRQHTGDRVVNKYFPGMAIIWLPFFLFGHLMAWLEIFPRDGYSIPYQYAIALSAFVFLYLGSVWLIKLLREFNASEKEASLLTLLITLGTNLLFYVVVEPGMTHVYSFALISGFLLAGSRLFRTYERRWFLRALTAFMLIILIRPTNGMLLLTIPFLAGNLPTMKSAATAIIRDKGALLRGIITLLVFLAVPVILWIVQTGKPFIYTYGEEKLNLLRPHIDQILFSFNRGWFLFTPVALVAMFGLAGLFMQDRFRFLWMISFLLLFIYVMSCWWVWHYASKFGQRVFIDIYPLVALLLLFLFRMVRTGIFRRIVAILLTVLAVLNLFQFWQQTRWIFPPYTITSEIYLDSFFSLSKKAKVYIPQENIAMAKTIRHDLEKENGTFWINEKSRFDSVSHGGKWSSRVNRQLPYSIGAEVGTDTLFSTANRVIRISAQVFSPRQRSEATLVVDYQHEGKSLSYNQFILEEYVPPDRWTPVEAAFYVPSGLPEGSRIKIYFYNPSPIYSLFIDDLRADFLSMNDHPDNRKLEGVLMAEPIK